MNLPPCCSSRRDRLRLSLRAVLFAAVLLPRAIAAGDAPTRTDGFAHFITRQQDRLVDGNQTFRWVSVNMPDSLQIITNYRFDGDQPATRYRLPDDFELRDCVRTVHQLGGRVMRAFVITCHRGPNPDFAFDVSADPVVPNEAALRVLDRLLQICNEEGVRLIIPLVAYNSGIRGDVHTYGEDFWTVGSPGNLKFKNMLRQLLTRTNTLTGRSYLDDKAILGWQTGNELVIGDAPDRHAWLHDIAAYIKSLDRHHLLIDGRNRPNDVFGKYDEFAADPNIDALSYHTYVNLPKANTPAGTLKLIRHQLHGKIPLIVNEIAMYTPPAALRTLLDEIVADGTSGGNWWAVRFHNRDGGFYKHSDRDSQFEDLNWPGFADPRSYLPEISQERELLAILSTYAARIAGTPPTPIPPPAAPHFLPPADVGHLSWQGSTGAGDYELQRATNPAGPWLTLQRGIQDNLTVYTPLFCDATAGIGSTYFYRVIAHNAAGASPPSNIVGPLRPDRRWRVDDLFDSSQFDPDSTNIRIDKAYAHSAYLEDVAVALRREPARAATLVYRVPGALRGFSLTVFGNDVPPRFSVRKNSAAAGEVVPLVTTYDQGKRALYHAELPASSADTLEIELSPRASPKQAVGRVELNYLPAP